MNYKIYKIVDNSNGNVYIGQTSQYIRKRIAQHKSSFNNSNTQFCCSSQQILANGDWSYEIVQDLLTKQVADDLEKYYIQNTPNCINLTKYNFNKNENAIKYHHYQNSWGGDKRNNNNLLLIDAEGLFN